MIFRSFPQENEKNTRAPLIRVNLISGALIYRHKKGMDRYAVSSLFIDTF
jgi:hypothetical protein